MNKATYNLRPLQDAALAIFKEFAQICERHGFRYYAMYGTALGAIRHKGFIPWDDDLDVVMPRPDYNAFVKVVNDELSGALKCLRGGETNLSSIYQSRIIDTRAGLVEELSEKTNLNLIYPPFVDIFILDALEDAPLSHKAIWGFRRRMRLVQMYRHPESMGCVSQQNKIKRLVARIVGMCLSPLYPKTASNEAFMQLLDQECLRRRPYESATRLAEINFFRMKEDRVIQSSELEPVRAVPFEDTTIRVPAKVEDILMRYYGDFMQYPEEASRVPAHQLRVMYKEHI